MARRVLNLPEWGRHVTEAMRQRFRASPDPQQEKLLAELETCLPNVRPGPDCLGFAVPLRLRTGAGDLRLPHPDHVRHLDGRVFGGATR
ncbi:hypothetical protein GCM10009838_68110 [Catenulispora subtropica]|uniref:Uncharacterized protein n=1 Tax=Catenulispora subtropica TaxID=450798 RepID=A0ABN2SXU2_9ACTN